MTESNSLQNDRQTSTLRPNRVRTFRPSLIDRLALRWSIARNVDGLWIGVFSDEPEPALRRLEEALNLIKAWDRCSYGRIVRELQRIWVRCLPGSYGEFDASLSACKLDADFVTSAPSTGLIAATIVHEATHARLARCGIHYDEPLRIRIEAVCLRREIAFATKIPDGADIREAAEYLLNQPAEFWASRTMAERNLEAATRGLRKLGMPEWLLQLLLTARAVRFRIAHAWLEVAGRAKGWFHRRQTSTEQHRDLRES